MHGMWQAELLNTIIGSFSTGVAPSTTSYESIATVTVGSGGAANVEFTSIPADYTHLQIRGIGRDANSAYRDSIQIRFNNELVLIMTLSLIALM